jgi:hypothetical protein
MISGPPKSEYCVAIEELLAPLAKIEKQLRDCVAPLERMKRFRFRSQVYEKEVAKYLQEAAAELAPFLEKYNLTGVAEQIRQHEAAATAAAKES